MLYISAVIGDNEGNRGAALYDEPTGSPGNATWFLYSYNPGTRTRELLARTGDDIYGDGKPPERLGTDGGTTADGDVLLGRSFGEVSDRRLAIALQPRVTSLSPSSVASGQLINIEGANLSLPGTETTLLIDGQVVPLTETEENLLSFSLPTSIAEGVHDLEVQLSDATGSLAVSAGQITVEMALPQPTASAVVHGATFAEGVAPCGIASLFGTTLTLLPDESALVLPLPTTLANTRLIIDGMEAPLFFVSAGQVNFQVPCKLGQGEHSLSVETATADDILLQSAPLTIEVSELAPGLFSYVDQLGQPQVIVVNQQFQLVTGENRLGPEDAFVVFGTGFGPTSPPVASGQPAPADELSVLTTPLEAFIGGEQRPMLFAGLAPGFVALYQINLQLPQELSQDKETVTLVFNTSDGQELAIDFDIPVTQPNE